MNPGATTERVHDALKRRIMDHDFRPGDRLDPAALAEALSASTTPVREALNQLVGEGLAESRAGGGFQIPLLDEPGLKDLYAWSGEVLALAIRGWQDLAPIDAEACETSQVAERTADLFLAIARRSVNREHGRAVERLNARLHPIRHVEAHVTAGIDDEVAAMIAAASDGKRDVLRRLISAYHRRRRRLAAKIVRAVYRTD